MTAAIDDDLWAAGGDPTRRRVFDLILNDGVATATTLSDRLPVTRQAVTKHLAVLDKAGLVHATSQGREKQYRANGEQVARIAEQLSAVGSPPGANKAPRRDHRQHHENTPDRVGAGMGHRIPVDARRREGVHPGA
ncbi:putative transcriptional regulator, ArsR [Mycobacteroides stephanolepidis]|uniref:Putative transcriptional regulator, ArsR n=1 Tax=[Mycobacterium] stephanolepidis TaxID=1520670 RepID=A0A1Z4EWD0_9MYCO|nr:putative transcriptional regulator, ArsR [[Mycobacterium] stephanolepidis]